MPEDKKISSADNQGNLVIYQSDDGETKIDVRFVDETVWLTQQQLCDLYQTSKSNISEHIKHIFEEEELEENSVECFAQQQDKLSVIPHLFPYAI